MAGEAPGLSATDNQTAGHAAKGVLLIVCVALFFGVLNASAVGVILPDIAGDLSVDTGLLSWLLTGFLRSCVKGCVNSQAATSSTVASAAIPSTYWAPR